MKRATKTVLMLILITGVMAPVRTLWAGDGPRGEGHGRGRGHGDHAREEHGRGHGHEARYFRPGDRTVILDYYSGPRRLPRGLAKKLARGEALPPGWERRFHPMPVVIARELPPPCATCGMGIIDGCAVVYDRRTRIILDVMALAGDLMNP